MDRVCITGESLATEGGVTQLHIAPYDLSLQGSPTSELGQVFWRSRGGKLPRTGQLAQHTVSLL